MTWIKTTPEGVVLTIHAVPRASKNEIAGLHGDALKVRLQSPPVDGKANKELIRFLSDVLDRAASHIALLSGESGRAKRLLIRGMDEADVYKKITKIAKVATSSS